MIGTPISRFWWKPTAPDSVTVQIVDPSTADIAVATVQHAGNTGQFSPKTPVNSSGIVNFEVLPGTNTFTAWVAGGYQTKTVAVAAGTSPTVTFTTETVTVQIVDPSTADIAVATVQHAGNTGQFSPKTPVDSNGTVTFQALPGTSTLTAWVARGYQTKTITVVAGSANSVTFSTHTVTVTVVDTSGTPRTNATVQHAGNTGQFSPKTPVDSNGTVTFQALPGTSTLTAWVGSSYKSTSVSVGGDTSLVITV